MLRWRLLGLILLALPAWAGNWNVRTQPRQGVVVWVQAPAVERPSGAGKHAGAQAGAHWGAQQAGPPGAVYGGAAGMLAGEVVEQELAAERWRNRSWTVHVQLDGGSVQPFAFASPPPWRRGVRVQIVGGRLLPMPGTRSDAGR